MGNDGAGHLSPLFDRRPIRWDAKTGEYRVELDGGLRQVLRELMQQFMQLLEDPDAPILHRVFPPAYSNQSDVSLQDEYRRLMQEDLVTRHREECEVVLASADAKALTEEQLLAWSRAINSIRLALGTYLDVSEDDPIAVPQTAEESAYRWLSYLLEETIEALSRQT